MSISQHCFWLVRALFFLQCGNSSVSPSVSLLIIEHDKWAKLDDKEKVEVHLEKKKKRECKVNEQVQGSGANICRKLQLLWGCICTLKPTSEA